jgi:hypothetical protein
MEISVAQWFLVALGGVMVLIGVLSYAGVLQRFGPETFLGRPAVEVSIGLGLIALTVAATLRGDDEVIAGPVAVLGVGGLVLVGFGLWVGFVGPPKWATPRWQREGVRRG